MARFIVVPKVHNGRHTSYEIIDTDAAKPHRARLGYVDDVHAASAVAAVLNEHRRTYTETLAALDASEPF